MYPKVIVLGKDTLTAITMDQVDSLNLLYINYDQCSEQLDSLESIKSTQDELISELENETDIQQGKISDLEQLILNQSTIIDSKDLQIQDRDKTIKKMKIKNKILGGVGGTIIAGLGVGLLIMSLK